MDVSISRPKSREWIETNQAFNVDTVGLTVSPGLKAGSGLKHNKIGEAFTNILYLPALKPGVD